MTRNPDLEALKAALLSAPASDATKKDAALALALESFDKSTLPTQGSRSAIRPTHDRLQKAGFFDGVHKMLASLKRKPVLVASTSFAALALGVFVFLPHDGTLTTPPTTAPAAAPGTAQLPDRTAAADIAQVQEPARQEVIAAPIAAPAQPMAKIELADPLVEPSIAGLREPDRAPRAMAANETFANSTANPVQVTIDSPVSTFSIDVDTASYAFVRDSLMSGAMPDPDAVRVEEMVNYFPYSYPAPAPGEAPFRLTVTLMPTPWNTGTRLAHIVVQGRMPDVETRPNLNLVFLIDTSGSMEATNKLPLLKQSLQLMLSELRPEDQIAIVAYAGAAGEVLPPTPASDREAILDALDRLEAGGATAGAEGLELAYRLAQSMTSAGEVSRVVLATDGDFNVGISDPEGLAAYIARKRSTGVFLSVLGFGRGTLDDATMQALTQNGNGMAAYIDTLQEARKVLVDQLSGALFPIANDVKIEVEWNPAQVAEYRLIGYETRALRREDFNNDAVDAGEIGAGHSVTAIYEVTAPDSPALLNHPLRYGTAEAPLPPAREATELGFLRLRYKAPGETISALIETPITADGEATEDARFAIAIAGFGQLLRGSDYLGDWGWDQAITLADANRGTDTFGYRVEAVNLMRLAKSLARK
ncbi:MAG: vWA domain-containing protein [Paracoccaceae bacterium]